MSRISQKPGWHLASSRKVSAIVRIGKVCQSCRQRLPILVCVPDTRKVSGGKINKRGRSFSRRGVGSPWRAAPNYQGGRSPVSAPNSGSTGLFLYPWVPGRAGGVSRPAKPGCCVAANLGTWRSSEGFPITGFRRPGIHVLLSRQKSAWQYSPRSD